CYRQFIVTGLSPAGTKFHMIYIRRQALPETLPMQVPSGRETREEAPPVIFRKPRRTIHAETRRQHVFCLVVVVRTAKVTHNNVGCFPCRDTLRLRFR